ncbi:hypothetical protein J3458_007187 [Metarhizium acridum]|uniref:uncharacterized protein n=1 Tax=Metarhizium acridum TaxID=92637 RepID=UPI001C6C94CA|nr:hypothetical protein J3458_007187 [Metarhizium acridum]
MFAASPVFDLWTWFIWRHDRIVCTNFVFTNISRNGGTTLTPMSVKVGPVTASPRCTHCVRHVLAHKGSDFPTNDEVVMHLYEIKRHLDGGSQTFEEECLADLSVANIGFTSVMAGGVASTWTIHFGAV